MLEPQERLRNAVIEGNLAITKRILSRFPSLWLNIDTTNGWNNLDYSSYHGNYVICYHLISFINQFKDNNSDLASILLNHGDMLTFDQLSPLHLTIIKGHLQTFHYLVTEFPGQFWINHKGGEYLQTPLHYCCRYGFVEGLRLLLEKGADYNLVDGNGNNLLHVSFEFGKFECIKVLLRYLHAKDTNTKVIKSFESCKNSKGWLPVELSVTFKLTKLYKSFKAELYNMGVSEKETSGLGAHSSRLSSFTSTNESDEFTIEPISITSSPNKVLASPIISVNEFKRAHSQSLPTQTEHQIIRQRASTSINNTYGEPSKIKLPLSPQHQSPNISTPILSSIKKTLSMKSLTISPSVRIQGNDNIETDSTSSSTSTSTRNSSPIKTTFPIMKMKSFSTLNSIDSEPESPSSIAAKIAFNDKSRRNSSSSNSSRTNKNSSNSINSINFSRIR